MPARRTGRSTDTSVTIYTDKVPTQQTAYGIARKDMVVQAQNIANFYAMMNETLVPWLNAHGIAGNQRLTFRQMANEYVKILNTKQGGDLLARLKIALKHKYHLRNIDDALLDDFIAYLENLRKTVTNYITFGYQSEGAK